MLTDETKRRQIELTKYIFEMANSCFGDDEIRKMAINLKALYTSNFRHNYSEFFSLILDISKNDNTYDLDFLSNNLEALRLLVEKSYVSGEKEFTGLYQPLTKLSDHLNLEIGRYSYYSVNEQKVNDLEKRNKNLHVELRQATDELMVAKDKVSSIQTELIAVISIFAAIILTFSGSISFVGSALIGMATTSLFKSTFFVILCGIIIFNAIFLMMYMVSKITERDIYAKCKSAHCTCGDKGVPKCSSVNRLRKRLPYVFWFNVVLIFFFILNIALWILNKYLCFVF